MIRLFKVKEKERYVSENTKRVFSSFSDLTIDENNSVFSNFSNLNMNECQQKSAEESAETTRGVFSIFNNLNLAENTVKMQSAGELRLYKDISELSLPRTTAIVFPNGKDNIMHFQVYIWPDEGCYIGGLFEFTFEVSRKYPYEAPKVHCNTRAYHPNMDYAGNVHLNILQERWNPVLSINTIIRGLHQLFLHPNIDEPLNHDAAALLRDDPETFASNVRKSMSGERVATTHGWRYFYKSTGLDVDSVLLPLLENPKAVTLV